MKDDIRKKTILVRMYSTLQRASLYRILCAFVESGKVCKAPDVYLVVRHQNRRW